MCCRPRLAPQPSGHGRVAIWDRRRWLFMLMCAKPLYVAKHAIRVMPVFNEFTLRTGCGVGRCGKGHTTNRKMRWVLRMNKSCWVYGGMRGILLQSCGCWQHMYRVNCWWCGSCGVSNTCAGLCWDNCLRCFTTHRAGKWTDACLD